MQGVAKWFSEHPCEAWHSSHQVGTPAWSRDVTTWRYHVQPHILHFAAFGAWKGAKVLDIGCGIGTDSLGFARAGAEVIGIDFSEESIRLANQRNDPFGVQVDFRVQDAEDSLPSFPSGKYNLVWAFGSIHHMMHPEKCLRKVREVISATGTFKLMVYARWSLKFLTGQQPEAFPGCPTVRLYTAAAITHLLEQAGFGVAEIRKAHIFPYTIERYKLGEFHVRWPYSWMSQGFLEGLGEVAGHHLLVTARPT